MPYGGSTKKQDSKIEDCVKSVMKSGKSKVSAIKICKSSIMGEKMEKETFTYIPSNEMEFEGTRINNVHIFKPGEYRGKKWTKKIVDKIVENFKVLKEKAGFEPPVRLGHRGDNSVENAKSVFGYIENTYSDEEGNLFADVEVYEDKDIDIFKKLKRSIEFGPYDTNEGEEFDTALLGLGLVDIPQVERLAEVNVYSKPLIEEMDKEFYDKTVLEAEELMAGKGSKEIVKECIGSLKKLLNSKIKDEKFFEVSRISDFISGLKTEYEIAEERVSMAKEGDSCKMPDGTDGKMKMKDGKMACMADSKMDKEEESKDKKDSAEEKDAKVNLDKEEADEKTKESEEETEDMDKEMVSMSKDEVAELKAAKEELEKVKAQDAETMMDKRMEKVDSLAKEVKILPAMVEKEKEFVEALTQDQFDKYIELKNDMPSLVELDKEHGKQKSEIDKVEAEKKAEELEKKTDEMVISTLMSKGMTREEAVTQLKKE